MHITWRGSGMRVGLRGTAGVEHEQPDAGVGEQVSQSGPVHELCVAGQLGIFKQQVAVGPATRRRHQPASG